MLMEIISQMNNTPPDLAKYLVKDYRIAPYALGGLVELQCTRLTAMRVF